MPERLPYRTDLTDAEWALLEPSLTAWRAERTARGLGLSAPTADLREVVNALRYLNRTGVQWDLLPHDFPKPATVRYYYDRWRGDGTDKKIHDMLRARVRRRAGRKAEPSAAMVDSQSVRSAFTARADTVGVDAHKKVKGRKRNLLVDTLGLLLHVVVTAADVHDVRPGRELIHYAALAHPWITKIWADGAYAGAWEDAAHRNIDLQITTRGLGGSGFTPVPQRWKVERTNSWIGRARRLAKDYEGLPGSAESQIRWAMTAMMLRRLTGRSTLTTYRVARSA